MDAPGKPWRGRIGLSSDLSQRGDGGGQRLPRLGLDLAIHARHDQFDGGLFRLADRLHLSAHDPALRQSLRDRGRRRSVPDRLGIARPRNRSAVRLDQGWRRRTPTDIAVWDYPFVAGLTQLAADVRSVFDGAGLTKNLTTWKNLIAYSPDWSTWNGVQHSAGFESALLPGVFSSESKCFFICSSVQKKPTQSG